MKYNNSLIHPNQSEIQFSEELVTEIGQAFTPREIIQQFINQDIRVFAHTPTDEFNDTNTSEEMLFNLVTGEDEFDTRNLLSEFRENSRNSEDDTTDTETSETETSEPGTGEQSEENDVSEKS